MIEIPKTQTEAAALLGVRPQTLAAWRCQGKGPRFLKVGRSVFYRESDIEAWLDAQAIVPVSKDDAGAAA
jgi:predicted DNA-binding transcriptional regulator AlpA